MTDTNELYDGPPVATEEILSVYVVVNGALQMSTGKLAAQVWHTGWQFGAQFGGAYYLSPISAWQAQGRRVVVRIAETEHLFQRVMNECEGIAQRDEGLTEVERGSITAFVTRPYTRAEAPKILAHKKVQLL